MPTDKPFGDTRLLSLDALRGLDMFFLVGFAGILRALPKLSDNEFFNWLAYQCSHPEWHGFTAYDVVFPMFIFIVGVAMPFSFSRRLAKGDDKWGLLAHAFVRFAILSLIGLVLWQRPIVELHPDYGWYSVLYRIGFSYFFAALIMLNTGIRGQIAWAVGLIVGHWFILQFVPVPGYGMGDYSQQGNFAAYISNMVATHISPDFRGLLSFNLIPSVANALFGVLAGQWLMSVSRLGGEKARGLLIAGVATMLLALAIHLLIPINKKLGSTSFTLLTCGISATLLAVFYWLIDVKGHKKWAFFLIVVGVNPLTIYMAVYLVKFGAVANVFVGGIDFGAATALVVAITIAALKWLFLYYLFKKRWFFNI